MDSKEKVGSYDKKVKEDSRINTLATYDVYACRVRWSHSYCITDFSIHVLAGVPCSNYTQTNVTLWHIRPSYVLAVNLSISKQPP